MWIKRLHGDSCRRLDGENCRKGQKEAIQARAEELGKSVNGYIVDLIEEDMGPLDKTGKTEV